MAGLNKLYGYV